ncbi:MAG: hypothetical protein GOMPHAMPRED_000607 [Gomphillus americanus]|uniref:Uncharacterized protein n=1 Tax=Gomphillus americanus TaxID=1940652 RepID=A0A8H3EFY1_9LECA|nr:MAG: hypothetical protein GOMPHAMPRED_000607 [Gomphillus americanus]
MRRDKKRKLNEREDEERYMISEDEKDWDSTDSGELYSSSKSSSDVSYRSSDSMLRSFATARRSKDSTRYPYRIPHRTMRWICIALMAIILLFILNLTRMGMDSARTLEALAKQRPKPSATWESFPFLTRYFGGLRTLVPQSENVREYPTDNITIIRKKVARQIPASQVYEVFVEYKRRKPDAVECYLDEENQIRLPNVHRYQGVPRGMPESVMGSSAVLGLSEAHCYDRYGRLGPYGFGYSSVKGGVGAGIEGEREGADAVWAAQLSVNYSTINWHNAQTKCYTKNKHRFAAGSSNTPEPWRKMPVKRDTDPSQNSTRNTIPRTALIIRTWTGYDYTPEVMLYLRSLVSELALTSAGEYMVHFLVHVKNDNEPIWADPDTYERVLYDALPAEFRGMGTLWSERQMNLIYGGLPDSFFRESPVHGVYRSAHFPLQYFAFNHPEYDYFWNWEMDTRYTGHWFSLFDSAQQFAAKQPRKGLWERNERFYVPEVHGSWEDFKQMVRVQSEMPTQPTTSKWANVGSTDSQQVSDETDKPIWGSKPPLDGFEAFSTDPVPPTSYEKDKYTWGVGEEADLITLNPIFDPHGTGWLLREDITSYNLTRGFPPRRIAVVSASRLSRRLLITMHNETTFHGHTMFTEMFPASIALHHGLKAVYVPHPVYIDRAWPVPYLAKTMNAGKNGAVGGARTTVFGNVIQHNLLGVSWHYNDGFAPNLWRRWLGYRVDNDGGEDFEINNEGRMCLPPILLHPVKDVQLVVEGRQNEEKEE